MNQYIGVNITMKKMSLAALALATFGLFQTATASSADSFFDAIAEGDASLSLRYRFEFVDQDGFNKMPTPQR